MTTTLYEIAPNSRWQTFGDDQYQGGYKIYYEENNKMINIKCKFCSKTYEYTNSLSRNATTHRKRCNPKSVGEDNVYIFNNPNVNG